MLVIIIILSYTDSLLRETEFMDEDRSLGQR